MGEEDDGSPFFHEKMVILQLINQERSAAGVPPVAWDSRAGSAAEAHATELVENKYVGHYSMNGFKPYQRYFWAGLMDHVSENVSGVSAPAIDTSRESLQQMMQEAHQGFMAQQAPEDADKRKVLDVAHTHVGIGIAFTDSLFRYVEVYLDRYVEVLDSTPDGEAAPPLQLTSDETFLVARSIIDGHDILAANVFYEPEPEPMDPEELDTHMAFEDAPGAKAAIVWPWEMMRLEDGSFRIPIFLPTLQSGHYYVQILVRDDVEAIPYAAPSDDLDLSAGNVVPATGLVLTCSPEQAAAFAASQQATETVADVEALETSTAEDTQGFSKFSELAVIVGSDPTPPGFRRQQLQVLDNATASSAVHLCMSTNPMFGPITAVTLVSAGPDVEDVPTPEGFELLPVNIAALVRSSEGLDQDPTANCVYLCVQRATQDGEPPLLDVALTLVDEALIPFGYSSTDTGLMNAGMSIRLCQSSDIDAVTAVASAAQVQASPGPADAIMDVEEEAPDRTGGAALEWQDGAEDLEFDDPASDEKRRAEERRRLLSMIDEAKRERAQLDSHNATLQRKLAAMFAARKPDDEKEAERAAADADSETVKDEKEKRYQETLSNVISTKDQLAATQSNYDAIAMDLQMRLDEKEAKAAEIQESFAEFKREIASAAENSRTGKPIPRRIIKQFEATEAAKDAEVEKVRLKNIHLRTQLRKLEQQLKESERLADGLHLIDFEQLKIENQTLNEKIEERHEELHKLKKKTTQTVQVLTHVKEKLQFVQAQVVSLNQELASIAEQVTDERDHLSKSKHQRDTLRTTNDRSRQQQGFVNNDKLVMDFEARKNEIRRLKATVTELKTQHLNMTARQTGQTRTTASRG